MRVLHQLIPDEMHDNELTAQCTLLLDKDALGTDSPMPAYIATSAGKPVAIAIEAIAPDGYNGNIKLIVGISTKGEVLGVRTLAHQETPGLGDKIDLRKSNWVSQFVGKVLGSADDKQWLVKKTVAILINLLARLSPRALMSKQSKTQYGISTITKRKFSVCR